MQMCCIIILYISYFIFITTNNNIINFYIQKNSVMYYNVILCVHISYRYLQQRTNYTFTCKNFTLIPNCNVKFTCLNYSNYNNKKI